MNLHEGETTAKPPLFALRAPERGRAPLTGTGARSGVEFKSQRTQAPAFRGGRVALMFVVFA